jgi:hypothetical protein
VVLFAGIFAVLSIPLAAAAEEKPSTPRVRLGGLAVVTTAAPPRPTPSPAPPPPVHFREIGWKIGPPERLTSPAPIYPALLGGAEEGTLFRESEPGWNREFIAALGRRFWKEAVSVQAVCDASRAKEQGCPEMVSEFAWHDGDFREVEEVRRDLVVNLVSGAAADTLEKTAPGRWVRALEAVVDRYSRVSYRRAKGAEAGHFLLPGQIGPKDAAAEDPVAVTASARLHLDSGDLTPEATFTVLADYFGYRCRFLMNPTQGEAGLFFASETLERLFGLRTGLGLSYDREAEEGETLAGVVRISGDF